MGAYSDVVVLIPGFFGFGRLGNFYYFADRVAAALRGALERELGRPTPVLALATRPVGSLAERQAYLLSRLKAVDDTLGGVERFHLVGHSAGGLDAELLRAAHPVGGGDWGSFDDQNLRSRVASIVTIASPLYGTCLAESRAVTLFREHRGRPDAWFEAAKLVGDLGKVALERPLVHEAVLSSIRDLSGSGRFLWELFTDQRLLTDLLPARVEAQRQHDPELADVPVTCFVVAAPMVRVEDPRRPDDLFELLRAMTAQCHESPRAPILRTLDALGEAGVAVVKNPMARLPSWSASTSDGVVNSARQLLQAPGAELGAIVMGDHADVLGHYDRVDPLTDGTPLNEGMFRSGAGFGDDQFFDLYGRVARTIGQHATAHGGSKEQP